MLNKVLGQAIMSKARKRLSGGPQSLKPMRPTRGSGIANGTGREARRQPQYVTPVQDPARSPRTGGLAMRGQRVRRGRDAMKQGSVGLGRKRVR